MEAMSNFTHIPRYPRDGFSRHNNNQQPKYNVHRKRRYEEIDEGAVKTIYDRSDRNYKPHNRGGFSPRRVTENRVSRKGIFGNAKASFVVMNDLPSSVRRHVSENIAAITAPDDSVEYVRQPPQSYRRDHQSQREERRRPYEEMPTRSREHQSRREERRRSYEEMPTRSREHQSQREERHRPYEEMPTRSREHQSRREDCRRPHEEMSTRSREHQSRREDCRRPHEEMSTRSREHQSQREERRRPYEEMPTRSTRKSDDGKKSSTFSGLASLARALPSCPGSPQSKTVNCRQSSYPSKLIRDRILFAVPKLSLRDDDHDKYGATTQELLFGSLKTYREGNVDTTGHRDILNRTSVIDYTSDGHPYVLATHDENVFQDGLESFRKQIFNPQWNPQTPELEKQFNETIAEELRSDENYLNEPPSPFLEADDFNVSLLFNGRHAEAQRAQVWAQQVVEEPPPSPGDAQLFMQLNEIANPPISSQQFENMNMGPLF